MKTLADTILYGTRSDVVDLLEQGEVSINEIDEYGYTPLIEAAIVEKTGIAKLLVSHGADVNEKDTTGRTALHWAAETNNIPLCQFLLGLKADPNAYTKASEPVLITPLLRKQNELKQLLYEHGADLSFAQDYITAKLVAHRFELKGQGEILNHNNVFLAVNYEGFIVEFTLDVICHSLSEYLYHFASRHLRQFFEAAQITMRCLERASAALKFQHYTVEVNDHLEKIYQLIDHDPIIIPVSYEGHAVTFVKLGPYFAKCDRGALSQTQSSVIIYEMKQPQNFNKALIKHLMYQKQKKFFIEKGIHDVLGLKAVTQLPLTSQITGNCSWANVEATLSTLMYMLWYHHSNDPNENKIITYKEAAMYFHKRWLEWDQNRAISKCINEFHDTKNRARKASKASLLGAVLFQHCNYHNPKDVRRAEKMLPILLDPEYDFVLRSYLEFFYKRHPRKEGKNLMSLIDICGYHIDL